MKFEILDINDAVVGYGHITVGENDHWTDIERKKDATIDKFSKKHNNGHFWCKSGENSLPNQATQWAILSGQRRTSKNQVLGSPIIWNYRSTDKEELIKIIEYFIERWNYEDALISVKDDTWESNDHYYQLVRI